MLNTGKIFVPYEDYYRYLADAEWQRNGTGRNSSGQNRIYYFGSEGLVYTGQDANFITASGDAIDRYMVGNGTTNAGNGYTSSFNGVLLGIPKYWDTNDQYQVKMIGPYAFAGCTTIERVTIADSVERIGAHAFDGCTGIKFIIMERTTPPDIAADTFSNMSADRIFVVPNSNANTVRNAYVSAPNWNQHASLIITMEEYEKMSSGGGFSHFVFNIFQETTLRFNFDKHDASMMTIIYGDGTSDVISTSGPVNGGNGLVHIYEASEQPYTMSIIARGPWSFGTGMTITGSESNNSRLLEVYLDSQYCRYVDNGLTIDTGNTIGDTSLLKGATNLKKLVLPNATITRLPQGFLKDCRSLESVTLPFVGRSAIDPTNPDEGMLGYYFNRSTGTTAPVGFEHVIQTNDGTTGYTVDVPSSLRAVTILQNNVHDGSFSGMSMLTDIQLPTTTDAQLAMTAIGNYAFKGCTNLASANLPNTIQTIGTHAFEGCSSLGLSSLPTGLTTIADYCFKDCSNITLAALPTSIVTIGQYAFYNCTSITLTVLPAGLTTIGAHGFEKCNRITISTLPEGVTTLTPYCFSECPNITLSVIPANSPVPDYCFNECRKVTFSELPAQLTAIGQYAFKGCNLVTFSWIPATVATIGAHAFDGCTPVNFTNLPLNLASIGEYCFNGCSNMAITDLPSIANIPAGAFKGCTTINIAVIPASIQSIGAHAFEGCYNVRITSLPNSVTLGEAAFKGCTSIRLANLPSALSVIPAELFSGCENITVSNIPANVRTIGSNAFKDCVKLGTSASEQIVRFGDSANSTAMASAGSTIAIDAFAGCVAITQIHFYSTLGAAFGTQANPYPAGYHDRDYDANYPGPWSAPNVTQNNVKSMNSYAAIEGSQLADLFTFEYVDTGERQYYKLTGVKEGFYTRIQNSSTIVIGANYYTNEHGDKPIEVIGSEAFKMTASNMTKYPDRWIISFTSSSAIRVIEDSAFIDNWKMESIMLPNTVTNIGEYAFAITDSMYASIVASGLTPRLVIDSLPSDLFSIGSYAFKNQKNLQFNIFPAYIEEIGDGAFAGCDNITALYMDSCNRLADVDISSASSGITRVTLPTKGWNMQTFKTSNESFVLALKFRAPANYSASGEYLVVDVSNSNNTDNKFAGFKVFIIGGNLYIGNNLVYEGIAQNTDYCIILRCTNTDEPVLNSAILAIGNGATVNQQFNEHLRYHFGYKHPVVSVDGTPITYGTYGFALDSNGADISLIEYVRGEMSDSELQSEFGMSLFMLPEWEDFATNTQIRVDFDTVTDRTVYVQGDDNSKGDRFNQLSFSQLQALGREGHIDMSLCTSTTPYKAQWHLLRKLANGETRDEAWLQCGECKSIPITGYPAGSTYTKCEGEINPAEGLTGPMWFEVVGFGVDKSDHMGSCPITIGMKELMPDKSQLYSASHNMRNTILSLNEDGSGGTANGTSITYTGEGKSRVWLIANDISCISAIKRTKNGATIGSYYFSSTTAANYKNFLNDTKYVSTRGFFDGNYEICQSTDVGALLVIADSATRATGQIFVSQTGISGITAGQYVKPVIVDEDDALLIDARLGMVERQTASECIVMTKGCKLGIPVENGVSVTITYYSSWNLSGWRDCIVRTNGNNVHFNALPEGLKNITETVVKYTNIGGLHTLINETKDKLWLYSLSEAGMYNATIPYCQEGGAFQWYQPSVASNGGRTSVRRKPLINNSPTYDYWWLRTPNKSDNVVPPVVVKIGNISFTYMYIHSTGSVCFGLSLKSPDRPRLYTLTDHLESETVLPITSASCVNPQSGITHIYAFLVEDKSNGVEYVDMRYPINNEDNSVGSGGYSISGNNDGIFLNDICILAGSYFDDGDKIGIIIRQPKVSDIGTADDTLNTVDLMVFKNDVLVNACTIETLNLATGTGNLGLNARAYSTSTKRVKVMPYGNGVLQTMEIYQKELTNTEITGLYVCRYLTGISA